jgi:hypothetical protein
MTTKDHDDAQDFVGQPTDSDYRDRATYEWTKYCLRFGSDPKNLIGMRYPGLEQVPMDETMARQVQNALDVLVRK